jgi:hypothetical protein
MKTLAERMVESYDATSKSYQLLKMLGVDVAAGPNKAIDQLAGVFSKLNDGATKTTLAVYLFGKTGMDMIPVLNQGREGIAKLRLEADRLGVAYGPDFAQAASEFNDNMKAIKASSEALGIALANNVMPALLRISAAMKEAAIQEGTGKALFVGLGGVLYEATGGQDAANARHLAISRKRSRSTRRRSPTRQSAATTRNTR